MKREELLKLLRENLSIEIYHPAESGCSFAEDEHNVVVDIYFGNELVCSSKTN